MGWVRPETAAIWNASVNLLRLKRHSSNNHDAVALFTTDRCGHARAERTDEERDERPVHGVRDRFAGAFGSLLRLSEGVIHSFFSLGFARSGLCTYDSRQIRSVCRRQTSFAD